jgi:serine-type D-Ala-D-Ala endopeptidase (penicillin-binding protein 7)
MVMQLASSSSVSRNLRQLSRWTLSCVIGGALACASFASSATATADTPAASTKHHRKAASVHAAPRARHAGMIRRTVTTRTTVRFETPSQSVGYAAGLHTTEDPLLLRSGAALVLDQETHEVLYSKNPEAVLPIASLSKLMTALVISEANQPLDEVLEITTDDIDTEKNTSSRLKPGTHLTRGVMLHLALMASENRAANALGRNYPGGLVAFVAAMNAKAKELGMLDTHYVEPTGLSSQNKSSARDLAVLVNAAHQVPLLREYSTTPSLDVELGRRQVQFHTTDRLVANKTWDIGLQKTGFINEAGQCLVMQAQMAGRKLIMVLLDSAGKYSRIADAERIRKWVTSNHSAPVPTARAATDAS